MAARGRRRIGLDWFPLTYRYRDLINKSSRIPLLGRLGYLLDDPRESTMSYIPVGEEIELPPGSAVPTSITEHFIRRARHHFILERCPCRAENRCQRYPVDIGCTFLGEAVAHIDVPPDVGRRVCMEEALEHERRAREAGLVSMVGKYKSDAWLMGVTREHRRLMTICHCCPCCCLVGSIRYAGPQLKKTHVRLRGLVVAVDRDRCEGCGACTEACMFGSMTVVGGKASHDDECRGCGFCAAACPKGAISLRIEDPDYIEEVISRIDAVVNVT